MLSEEINKMRAACTRISNGAYQPGITFIVVEKRHHTRLFPVNKQDEVGFFFCMIVRIIVNAQK